MRDWQWWHLASYTFSSPISTLATKAAVGCVGGLLIGVGAALAFGPLLGALVGISVALADMEGVLVKRQGEAVSTTVAVDTASVTGCRWWWRACR